MIKISRFYGIQHFKYNREIKNPNYNALLNPVYTKFLFLSVEYLPVTTFRSFQFFFIKVFLLLFKCIMQCSDFNQITSEA